MLKITLDSNLFYDLAQERRGAAYVKAILDLAREGKVLLFSTPTTDFEDQSGTAISTILKLMRDKDYTGGSKCRYPDGIHA